MYAVTGITGKVGGIVARTLLAAGLPVRAVVRNVDKGRPWAEKGCEIVIASITDADGLTKAFSGVDGVFLMTPPDFDPAPGFPCTQEAIAAVKTAISAARPGKVVFLSTVGAQVAEFNLLNNSKITEEGLRTVPVESVAFETLQPWLADPLDLNGTTGDTCSFDPDCGPGSKCLKSSGSISGVCKGR